MIHNYIYFFIAGLMGVLFAMLTDELMENESIFDAPLQVKIAVLSFYIMIIVGVVAFIFYILELFG